VTRAYGAANDRCRGRTSRLKHGHEIPSLAVPLGASPVPAHRYTEAIRTIQPLTEGARPNAIALNLIAGSMKPNGQTPDADTAPQRAIRLVENNVNNYLDLTRFAWQGAEHLYENH